MKVKIGNTAGKIWETLRKKEEIEVSRLPSVVYQALGWLARENRLNYHTKKSKTFVSLIEFKQNIELH